VSKYIIADPSDDGHSEHPIVAVNAIIFDAESKVLLTQRADNGLWCLPGGLVTFGETVEHALVRELDEEIGVSPSQIQLTGVYSANNISITRTARRCSIILAFMCEIDEQVPGVSEEVRACRYFSQDDLPIDIVENHQGRIMDAVWRSGTPVVK
jgi:ADP-ribose pyrophosphatase YjhB (NUDIX family)